MQGNLQEPEQKQEHECELGAHRDLQVDEDPHGQGEDEEVREDVESSGGGEQHARVDAPRSAISAEEGRGIPGALDRNALEDDGKKHGHHVGGVGDVHAGDVLAHPALLPEQPQQEQQNRCLDQRQDRVVQKLHCVSPDEPL